MSESEFDYDLFVIGAGSGGVRAARMAANQGARVAVAEERDLGGTCVNVGCVPKKLFVYASHFAKDFHDASAYGWDVSHNTLDWPTLRDNKSNEIKRLNGIYQNLLESANVDIIDGRARLAGPNTVVVAEKKYRVKKILLATGGWPFVPEFPGSEHVITSNEVFFLDQLPKNPVVIGGGYIGVEFAGIFNGLGCNTHLLYRGSALLRQFDAELGEVVCEEMRAKGLDIRLNTDISGIDKQGDNDYLITLGDGSTLQSDCILYATGRTPALNDLGLETVNVKLDQKGKVLVNTHFETSEPSVFALGDIIDSPELTPVAIAEAMVFVRNEFQGANEEVDYHNIPTAVFCQPNIGTVGLTEAQARENHQITVFTSRFRALKHSLTENPEKTFMKMIVDSESDLVLGVHMIGSDAGEIIQGIGVALKAGATKAVFDSTIGIHPTSAEEFVTMREATRN